jgi:hypothetical protein
MNPDFATVKNIKHCEGRFKSVIESMYKLRVDDGDGGLRRLLYDVIMEVRERHAHSAMPLKDLNNLTLNIAHDRYMASNNNNQPRGRPGSGGIGSPKQAASSMDRDKDVYGDRAVLINPLIPGSTTPADLDARSKVVRQFDSVLEERKVEKDAQARTPGLGAKPMTVDAIAGDDFNRLLAQKERERDLHLGEVPAAPPPPPIAAGAGAADLLAEHEGDAELRPSLTELRPPLTELRPPPDPQAVARSALRDRDAFNLLMENESASATFGSSRAEVLVPAPPPEQTRTVERFVTLCGFDRDPSAEPYRFSWTASTSGYGDGDLQGTYRGVEFVEATRVVVPMEIVQSQAAGSLLPKSNFNHEFSFAFPYVLLSVTGFDGALDGMNDALRRAFCVFMYDTSYKAPNGRGYVLLKPAQGERRSFSPPLASLRDIRLSILRPNGALLNNSVDTYTVSTVQYDLQNRLYLRIVTHQFFDRNELFTGDSVRFRGFRFTPPASPAPSVGGASSYSALAEFLNRPQGHELVQIGPANDQAFHRTFFILAPGVLDQAAGRVIIDSKLVAAVQSLGAADAQSRAEVAGRPLVMNLSLQSVVTLRLGIRETFAASSLQALSKTDMRQ